MILLTMRTCVAYFMEKVIPALENYLLVNILEVIEQQDVWSITAQNLEIIILWL